MGYMGLLVTAHSCTFMRTMCVYVRMCVSRADRGGHLIFGALHNVYTSSI